MATTVTVYKNTDTGAPELKNLTGLGLGNVLDKCLVTGYGTKVAAGWTKPFSGTDKAAFKQGGGNGMYLRTQEEISSGLTTRLTGYETMTDVDTGTGDFPASSYNQLGSVDGAGLARPWVVVADDRTVYYFADVANNLLYYPFMFGDIYSYTTSDSYRTALFGGMEDGGGGQDRLSFISNSLTTTTERHYMARSYTGVAGALLVGKHGDGIKVSGTSAPLGLLPYPNPSDSKIWLSPVYIHETAEPTVRGKMRGYWQWLHPTAGIADQDTWPGAGALAGKTFMAIRAPQSNSAGIFVIETSSTWDTN